MVRDGTEPVSDIRVELAVQRTELALHRTQLSWARTVIGLIGAGVALDKGLRFLHEARVLSGQAWTRNGHAGGLTLTAVSTLLLIVVSWEHWKTARWLSRLKGAGSFPFPFTLIVSFMVIVLGAIVFVVLLADKSP
jgi:uncharacterized membrane protein YidH (DUF202 family)